MVKEVQDNVLGILISSVTPGHPHEERLQVWKKLCGPVRDISRMPPAYCGEGLFNMDVKQAGELLARMAEGGELRADAESPWLSTLDTVTKLRCVLRHVTITRSTGRGISNLAMTIITRRNARLLKEVEALGILGSEPREELLAYAIECNADPAFRAAILSLNMGTAERAVNGNPVRGHFWSSRWAKTTSDERLAWLQKCWEGPLDREACGERVETFQCDRGFERVMPGDFWMFPNLMMDYGDVRFWNLETAACCGANPTLMEVMLADGWLSNARCDLRWTGSEEELVGTPLCVAAAAGRLEQVKLLLNAGEAVNDTAETRSRYSPADPDGWAAVDSYIVTPLYMALQKGYKDVAEYLRARGGVCYPEWKEEDRGNGEPCVCGERRI